MQRYAICARVSTLDQEPENQLAELRRYAEVRGWTAVEYVDHGVSGTKDRRPALDRLLKDAGVGSLTCSSPGSSIASAAI